MSKDIFHEEYLTDTIERYLSKSLEEEELNIFEERLKNDPELKKEIKAHKLALVFIEKEGSQSELKAMLKDFHQNMKIEEEPVIKDNIQPLTPSKAKTSNYYWLVAASVLIILGVFWWFNRSMNPEERYLAVKNLTETTDIIYEQTMGGQKKHTREDLIAASQLYRDEEYQAAEEALLSLTTDYAENDTLFFIIGRNYLALKQPQKAIENFNKVLALSPEEKETIYNSEWNLVLADIMAENWASAQKRLEAMSIDENHKFQSEAREALAFVPE